MQYLEVVQPTYYFYALEYKIKGLNYYAATANKWLNGVSAYQPLPLEIQQPNPNSYIPIEEFVVDTSGYTWGVIPTTGGNARFLIRIESSMLIHDYKSSAEQHLHDNAPDNSEGFFSANSGKIILASTALLGLVTFLLVPKK